MKLHIKLLIVTLLPIFLFMGAAGGISYYFAYKALIGHSKQWLDIRLSEAMSVVKKHENILHKYDLQNILASIAKAKLDALAELSSADIGEHGYIFIADRQGVIVSHPDKYYVGTDASLESWFKQLSRGKRQTHLTIKDKKHIAAHKFFKPWDWHLIAVESKKNIGLSIQKIKFSLLFLAISAFILVFCFITFFIRHLTRPLELIKKSVRQIEAGRYDTQIPIQSNDEFSNLADTFNCMTKHFQDRLNQLQKEHAYYNTLSHHATDLITITDSHGRFTFISPSAKRIIGYDPDELFGKKVSDFMHSSEKDLLAEHFRLGVLSDVSTPPAEFRFKHKNGYWCTLESISKNLLSHPDVKGFVTTSRNINQRKSAQKDTDQTISSNIRENHFSGSTRLQDFNLSIESIKQCCNKHDAFKEKLCRDIVNHIPESKEGINITQINRFAARTIQLGKDFELAELIEFGDTLSGYAQTFDIENLENCLNHLRDVINAIDLD